MAHERNVEGLRKSAQSRHQQTMQQAEEGLRQLLQQGRPVNFNTVAEAANVSTSWLYQHPEWRERIEHLRKQQRGRTAPSEKTKASSASKDAMIAALRQRIQKLERENGDLKRQVEVTYGLLCQQGG